MRSCTTISRLKVALLISSLIVLFSCKNEKDEEQVRSTNPKIDKLKLAPGFTAQHLYSPSENEKGSWVSMTFDDKGRMIVSDQYGSLYRIKIPAISNDTAVPKLDIEKLTIRSAGTPASDSLVKAVQMGYAQGLLYAFNSLYVMVNHRSDSAFRKGSGLYRLTDTDNDDQFDKIDLLKAMQGEGEHGPHSIILAPDGKSLYLIAGNYTDLPEMNSYLLPKTWKEDNLFPKIVDPNGHAVDRTAPGSWIAKINPEGTDWQLVSAGYRNAFDLAFNEDGELFTYDSDMEWDFGMPWYQPTRICHVTSGSEYGWRTASIRWPPTFADDLPAVINIGQGSPTNLVSGKNAKFPEKYRKSIFAFDWSFGIIYAIQPVPNGSTYSAKAEEFISGSPLPLTDGVIGPDGALYFLTGGRRLESDLYRVYYTGKEDASPEAPATNTAGADARKVRHDIEQYHQKQDTGAIAFAWNYLNNPDRFIRYAARIAVEHQPLKNWQAKALQEKDPVKLIYASVALARTATPAVKKDLYNALLSIDYASLTDEFKNDYLRAVELAITRMGKPDGAQKTDLITKLDAHYPAATNLLNRSFSKILVYLDAPDAVSKTMALMEKAIDDTTGTETVSNSSDLIMRNLQYGMDIASTLSKTPPAQQIYYAVVLSEAKTGWTAPVQEKYFKWYYGAFGYKGGNSYIGFIDKARKMALAHVSKADFHAMDTLSGSALVSPQGRLLAVAGAERPKGPGRRWTVEEALPIVEADSGTRDYDRGKNLFAATLCSSCHGMNGEGGAVGPDLTQLGTRFSAKDMLEAIIDPNKTISDQYTAKVYTLKSGNTVMGRQMSENDDAYIISQNPFDPTALKTVPKADVTNVKNSPVSIMLPGMINGLNPDELKDLIAYLRAGGNKDNAIYKSKVTTASK